MIKRTNPPNKVELSAVIVTLQGTPQGTAPQILLDRQQALPTGPFVSRHRTLEQGLRGWVASQSGLQLGYVEQLYTFADKDRLHAKGPGTISISYLALTRQPGSDSDNAASWSNWYSHLPWEDHRDGPPDLIAPLRQRLMHWQKTASDSATRRARTERLQVCFPIEAKYWNEELVLQRYELLWEAGLLPEARPDKTLPRLNTGTPLAHDHRRILATGMARLRAKIKYRPVVFELMPPHFTLLQLQNTVEALAGLPLHKQNFRRLVQGQGLVEEARGTVQETRGRPAQLYAFRAEVLRERAVAGTKLPRSG